jgi:radical SAM protein with 4Fe4S-binding SPASM domain
MLYKQRFDTFIRKYDDIGYICNKKTDHDMVVDEVGAFFLSALSRTPQSLEEVFLKIAPQFIDVDNETLKNDIKEFYVMLEEDGFIVSGQIEEELEAKDKRFSYADIDPKKIKNDFTSIVKRSNVYSQTFLVEHFKKKPHLISLQIELTSRCNERCVHCYIPHENKYTDIEDSLFHKVLEQSKEIGLHTLVLTGGEPMMHPNFIEYLRKVQEYDFEINLLSNLTLLNNDIVREMKASRISGVQVSLYSMKPEVHDSITMVKGSFYKTQNAILKLIENDIPLQISCVLMKQNKNDFIDVLNWANKHKVRAITDYIMMGRYDHSTSNLDNRLSLNEVENIINAIVENDEEYKNKILNTDFNVLNQKRDSSEDIICNVCMSTIGMVANGSVYPCVGWQNYILGNLKTENLQQIWENSPKVKFLRNIRKKDFPKCLECEDKMFCTMCMVRNANENDEGDPFKVNNHFCKVAALNKKLVLDWKNKIIIQ